MYVWSPRLTAHLPLSLSFLSVCLSLSLCLRSNGRNGAAAGRICGQGHEHLWRNHESEARLRTRQGGLRQDQLAESYHAKNDFYKVFI